MSMMGGNIPYIIFHNKIKLTEKNLAETFGSKKKLCSPSMWEAGKQTKLKPAVFHPLKLLPSSKLT